MAEIEYAAAGGVIIDGDKMLVLRRPARGEIRLPKGHIEEGETADVTALRETREETGLADLEIVASLGSQVVEFEYEGDQVRRTEYYYLMRARSNRQIKRPAKDATQFYPEWKSVAAAVEALTFPAEKEVAQKAVSIRDKVR